MTAADVEQWLTGTFAEALELQRPEKDSVIIVQPLEKKAA